MIVYIRLKDKCLISKSDRCVALGALCDVWPADALEELRGIVFPLTAAPFDTIDAMRVLRAAGEAMPGAQFELLGADETLIERDFQPKKDIKWLGALKGVAIAVFFFLGAATAILNFHADVGLSQAHKVLYEVITGQETEFAPLLSIPYSIGLGIGMSLFFMRTRAMRKRGEPDALHIKMDKYESDIDAYRVQRANNTKKDG